MIIQLRDRQEIVVRKDEANQIKEAIQSGVVGLEVRGEWFRADYVVRIKVGGNSAEVIENQLPAPDFRGKPSEAKEKLRKMLKEKKLL